MNYKLRCQNGQALLMAIFVVVVMSTLLIALITLAGTSKKAAYLQFEVIQASYIADAGLEKMLVCLKYDKKWNNPQSISASYADGVISDLSISTESSTGNLELTSTGRLGNSQKTLTAKVNITPAAVFNTYNSSITAHCDGAGNITENISLSPVLINESDKKAFKILAVSYGNDHYISGDTVFNGTKLQNISGLYYVEGNVHVSGNYSGRASIVATGDIYVDASITTASLTSNSLALICYHNINLELSSLETVINAVIWSEGSLNIFNNAGVLGSIMSSGIYLNGNTMNYQFSSDLVNQMPPGLPVFTNIIYWKEKYPVF